MSVSTVGGERVELSSRTAALAVADFAAIAVFVGVGEVTHGYNPFVDVGRFAGTLAPFLLGWVLVGGLTGVYGSDVLRSRTGMAVRTLGSWVLAVVVAQLLRATAVFHGDAALTFALVSVAIGGTLLVVARTAASLLLAR
ncbi:DUF3054 domain-containing protein [Haloarcula marina]|uniref:DUF3054 domain-containing protein n=1 Tax=Haloarcula marina TaxID=2961574 RepID=UPI0020B7FB66|nr:DUF3054 domain-containing protein [Halomicroarcula marina]